MDIENIKKSLFVGIKIKKPRKETEIIKITDDGFYYRIGEKNKKKVTYEEVGEAIKEVKESGILSRKWYRDKFYKTACSKPCKFTTIGGLLVKLQLAEYIKGKYLYKAKSN
jgi:hypothetical protein